MLLNKAQDCLKNLNNIFDRTTHDFTLANALCNILYEVEKQGNNYKKMLIKLLKEHYNQQEDGEWLPKNGQVEVAVKKMSDLDELSFTIPKVTISKPEFISPRELYYLKEFFDFE